MIVKFPVTVQHIFSCIFFKSKCTSWPYHFPPACKVIEAESPTPNHEDLVGKTYLTLLASGLQFVDEDLDENHAVATAMKKLEWGTDEICAEALNEITGEVVGASYVRVAGYSHSAEN